MCTWRVQASCRRLMSGRWGGGYFAASTHPPFLETGVIHAFSHWEGTSLALFDIWKNAVIAGAISAEIKCLQHPRWDSSGPGAFLGFRARSSFSIPCCSTANGGICGNPVPGSRLVDVCGSSFVNADLSCSLNIFALAGASEYSCPLLRKADTPWVSVSGI